LFYFGISFVVQSMFSRNIDVYVMNVSSRVIYVKEVDLTVCLDGDVLSREEMQFIF